MQTLRYGFDGEPSRSEVDLPPMLWDSGAPLYCWGVRPTFFDAPSTTAREADWSATAFLVASPDAVMRPRLEPVRGFRWGYQVRDAVPRPVPPAEVGAEGWREVRSVLERGFPGWSFG